MSPRECLRRSARYKKLWGDSYGLTAEKRAARASPGGILLREDSDSAARCTLRRPHASHCPTPRQPPAMGWTDPLIGRRQQGCCRNIHATVTRWMRPAGYGLREGLEWNSLSALRGGSTGRFASLKSLWGVALLGVIGCNCHLSGDGEHAHVQPHGLLHGRCAARTSAPWGTVTVSSLSSTEVSVSLMLAPNEVFNIAGGNGAGKPLLFDISGSPTVHGLGPGVAVQLASCRA